MQDTQKLEQTEKALQVTLDFRVPETVVEVKEAEPKAPLSPRSYISRYSELAYIKSLSGIDP